MPYDYVLNKGVLHLALCHRYSQAGFLSIGVTHDTTDTTLFIANTAYVVDVE